MTEKTVDYFGLVAAHIDHEAQTITLQVRRYSRPMPDSAVTSCKNWARSVLGADWPEYTILDPDGHPTERTETPAASHA